MRKIIAVAAVMIVTATAMVVAAWVLVARVPASGGMPLTAILSASSLAKLCTIVKAYGVNKYEAATAEDIALTALKMCKCEWEELIRLPGVDRGEELNWRARWALSVAEKARLGTLFDEAVYETLSSAEARNWGACRDRHPWDKAFDGF